MSTEKMRRLFQEWANAHYLLSELNWAIEDGEYEEPEMQCAWEAWQASRAAIEVQAPDDGIEDCQEKWGEQCKNTFDCGYNFASMRYDQAIESLGLKVKP